MASKHCGGKTTGGRKTVSVGGYKRSTPSDKCYGPGKPGPKTVTVDSHKRSK